MSLFDTLSHLFIDRSTEGVSHLGLYCTATVLFLLGSLVHISARSSRAAEFIETLSRDDIPGVNSLAIVSGSDVNVEPTDGMPAS